MAYADKTTIIRGEFIVAENLIWSWLRRLITYVAPPLLLHGEHAVDMIYPDK